jgi:hypothetical protein
MSINEEVAFEVWDIKVYRNPKSIKRMSPDLRAISDMKGDLYVMDDSSKFTHSELVKWLIAYGLAPKYTWYDSLYEFGSLVAWTRVSNTDTFKLGESYRLELFHPLDENNLTESVFELYEQVKQKNPQYSFKLESIWEKGKNRDFTKIFEPEKH